MSVTWAYGLAMVRAVRYIVNVHQNLVAKICQSCKGEKMVQAYFMRAFNSRRTSWLKTKPSVALVIEHQNRVGKFDERLKKCCGWVNLNI